MKTLREKRSPQISEQLCFEAYGVKIAIKTQLRGLVEQIEERLKRILPDGFEKIDFKKAEHVFEIEQNEQGTYVLLKDKVQVTSADEKESFLTNFDSLLRLTVAEFAVGKVFIHAGVVGWKGRAIVIPARTYRGKTTLVKELTKLGAIYYSDDFAILDENGFVHPYPKTLSIRGLIDKLQQVEFPVEYFGGKKGINPIPVGMILITEYKSNAKWRPQILSDGQGVMEMLSHTIPIRYNPKFSLKVLNKTVNRAIIVKSRRGEAKDFALKLLKYFEDNAL